MRITMAGKIRDKGLNERICRAIIETYRHGQGFIRTFVAPSFPQGSHFFLRDRQAYVDMSPCRESTVRVDYSAPECLKLRCEDPQQMKQAQDFLNEFTKDPIKWKEAK